MSGQWNGPQVVTVGGGGGPGLLIRALWFILVGWWLGGVVITIAYALCITIIGLPVAFVLFNLIPTAMTLRPRSEGDSVVLQDGTGRFVAIEGSVAQAPLLIRAVWFVLVGWWLGAIWLLIAYLLCVVIVGIPIGLLMFNRVGGVMTLHRY